MKYITGFILAAILIFVATSYFNNQSYKKTWWDGDTSVRLCKIPYTNNSECSVVIADSTDGRITSLLVSEDSFYIYESECFKAADVSDGIDRFCRISESGQKYDVLPL